MQQQQIPGMAGSRAVAGENLSLQLWPGRCGVAQRAVTPDTVFELGSISKTYAGVIGAMALNVVILS